MKRWLIIGTVIVGACVAFSVAVVKQRETTYVATAECIVTMANSGHLSVDVGQYLGATMKERRKEIVKAALGVMLADNPIGSSAIQDACAALVALDTSIEKSDARRCRVTVSSRAKTAEAAQLAVRCYVLALKAEIESEEDRRCARTLEEIQLNALKMRLRIDELARMQRFVKGVSSQVESKVGDAMREAKEKHDEILKEEKNVRRVLSETRIRVEIPAQ